MALNLPPYTSYDWAAGRVRNFDEPLTLLTPFDSPMIARIGLNGGSKFGFKQNNYKYEWGYDELRPRNGMIHGQHIAGLTTLTIHSDVLHPGDIVALSATLAGCDDGAVAEYVRIVSRTSDSVYVMTRNWNGIGAVQAEDNWYWKIVGMARAEGAKSDVYVGWMDPTLAYNVTSIVESAFSISNTDDRIARLGINNVADAEGDKAMPYLMEKIEANFWRGIRSEGSKALGIHSMGGVDTFITTAGVGYLDKAGAAITKDEFDTLFQAVTEAGGKPDLIVTTPKIYKALCQMKDDFYTYAGTPKESSLGTGPVKRIVTYFGDAELMYDRLMPAGRLYGFQTDLLGMLEFRAPLQTQLGVTGDTRDGFLVAEHSLIVKHGDEAHIRVDDIG
jgi:hypothetical protein